MARQEHSDGEVAESGRNGPPLFLILALIVAGITASFVIQNRDRAEIKFLFFTFNSRIWSAIAIAILLGILLDRLVLMWWRRARRRN